MNLTEKAREMVEECLKANPNIPTELVLQYLGPDLVKAGLRAAQVLTSRAVGLSNGHRDSLIFWLESLIEGKEDWPEDGKK